MAYTCIVFIFVDGICYTEARFDKDRRNNTNYNLEMIVVA